MATSGTKFSKGYAGAKKKKPDPPSQSGGTSGDLSVPDWFNTTPIAEANPKHGLSSFAPSQDGTRSQAAQMVSEHERKKGVVDKLLSTKIPKIEELPLGPEATEFAEWLSHYTGLDPHLTGAWVMAEGAGESATSKGEAGKNNWLAAGYPGERTPFSEAPFFNEDAKTAAKATADWMKGKLNGYGGYDYSASSGIRNAIAEAKGKPLDQQAAVMASSGWVDGKEGVLNQGYYDSIMGNAGSINVAGTQPVKDSPGSTEDLGRGVEHPNEVRTAIDVIPPQKLFKWLEPSEGSSTGQKGNIARLNPVLARHLLEVAIASGDPLQIDSAQRMVKEQEEISSGTNPKAPPGLSAHQFGMAADLEATPSQDELFAKYGLEHGEGGAGVSDPPHTELTDPKLIERAAKFGPVRSGYLPAGMPNVEGDISKWTTSGPSEGFTPYAGPTGSGGSLGSLGSSVASGSSTSGGVEGSNPILNAALNKTDSSGESEDTGLSRVLGFLDSPVPKIGEPLEPLTTDDELFKLATRRRV